MNDPATPANSTPSSKVSRIRIGVATHVAPKFTLTGNEALQDLLLAIDECVNAGELKIIVDFSAVQMIDSLCISAMMDLQDRLTKLGGWVKVSGHSKIIAEIAQITGFADYVSFLSNDSEQDRRESDDVSFGPGARLGDILVMRGLIDEAKIDEAL